MDLIPLREVFDRHEKYMTSRLDQIDRRLERIDEKLTDHSHGRYIPWTAGITILIAAGGLLLTVLN